MPLSSIAISGDHPQYIWRNGKVIPWDQALIHVNAVGHASVSAVFEGIKAYWNPRHQQLYVFRLQEHMTRLINSMRIIRLHSQYTADVMAKGVIDVLVANGTRFDTYVRPWIFARGFVRELMIPPDAETEAIIDTWPFHSQLLSKRGCRACISSWTRIADNVMPPRVKAFANYHNSRFGMMEAVANGWDFPIFLNSQYKVTEGPGACVAIVRDGVVFTPPITSGILDSITRSTILRLIVDKMEVSVVERDLDRTELYLADEMFYMGTGWEVLPIVAIDGRQVGAGSMGPVTKAIDRNYHDVVRGIDEDYAEWRTAVWP